ncbi:hypothetical protein GcM3_079017 [Golovinomyces cichoracearum]|uniref:Uncharacterized protein n=1 Tax=Golovinomyces cichoracearum TaxID=62708 RepID=A0A420IPA0_9PEZI|nr:hypothetical protein GcM3_079017 [Golovinomyces cichoracearum]
MAPDSKTQNSCCSSHTQNLKLISVKRPKLIQVAATAPSLQTSITPKDAQYSHSSTRAAALLTRIVTEIEIFRQVRGNSIGSIGSSYSTSDDQQSPKDDGNETEAKNKSDRLDTYSNDYSHPSSTRIISAMKANMFQGGNYFSFPDFEDFGEYRE